MPTIHPHSSFGSVAQLDADERDYLNKTCVPAFESLLVHSRSYTSAEIEQHVQVFTNCVALWLTGRRVSSLPTAKLAVRDWAPVSLSVNFKASVNENHEARTVRFTFEPHKTESIAILNTMARLIGDPDLSWCDQVADALLAIHHSVAIFTGIDCEGSSQKMKAYFSLPKMSDTGMSRNAFILSTIRSLAVQTPPNRVDFSAALNLIETFLPSPAGSKLFLHPIGLDCPDSSTKKPTRIKIYALLPLCNSWSMVQSVHTLGGQLPFNSAIKERLDKLRSIWNLLRGEARELRPEDEDFSKPPRYPTHFINGLIFSFELISGRDIPEIKTYVPPYQYMPTDRCIAANIAQAFRKLGWHQASLDYPTMLESAFPRANLDRASNPETLHDSISFACSPDTGPYLTVYYRERWLPI